MVIKERLKNILKEKKELAQIINNHICDYVASVTIEEYRKHKLQFVYAKNLFYKNTVLIGNVAHNIHPIAGQGL